MPKILLIEDDELLQKIITLTLERLGYRIIWISSGKGLRKILQDADFALVLLDLSLGGEDGFGLLSIIRKMATKEQLPVVICSGFNGIEYVEKAIALGANDYLVKPFTQQELIMIVEKYAKS